MKVIRIVFGLLLAALLSACGGGGGSAGANPNTGALRTSAGDSVIIAPGETRAYTISGGVAPYSVRNSDVAIAQGSVSGAQLTIAAKGIGSATVEVVDNGGAVVTIAVRIGSSTPLSVTAPASLSMALGPAAAQTFDVRGGVAPYVAVSSDARIAGVSLNPTTLKLTVTGISVGQTSVTVRDGTGEAVSFGVSTTAAQPLSVAVPSELFVAVGSSQTYKILGGVKPYQVSSGNPEVLTASKQFEDDVVIRGVVGGEAVFVVSDIAGSVVTFRATVGSSNALFTTAPSALTLAPSATSQTFAISGGAAPYTVTSSNTSLATVTFSGTSFSITAGATVTTTPVNIIIKDSKGTQIGVSVGVSVAGGGSTAIEPAASIEVLASSTTIQSGGAAISITAFVKNRLNASVANEPVTFSADSGLLQSVSTKTDANGVAQANLTVGADKTNRPIRVTVRSGVASNFVIVNVIGTRLVLSGDAAVQRLSSATLAVRALDSANNPIPGASITLSSSLTNTLLPSPSVTDSLGVATATYTAVNSGNDVVTASGLGATAQLQVVVSAIDFGFTAPDQGASVNLNVTRTVTVRYTNNGAAVPNALVSFTSTRGSISGGTESANVSRTNASGDASVQVISTSPGPATVTAQVTGVAQTSLQLNFVAINPATISVQANPGAIPPNSGGSTLSQSTIEATVRDSGGNPVQGQQVNFRIVSDLSSGTLTSSTALSDLNGKAQVQYIAGSVSTAVDGVVIEATVNGSVVPALTRTASLTVNGQTSFLTIGFGSTIEELNAATYKKTFSVYLTDATGNPVGSQAVSISVVPQTYGKGLAADSPGNPICPNTDTNKNGIVDAGESTVGGALVPGNVVLASPGTVTTDSNGIALFSLQYGKQYATWVTVNVVARTTVQGTETSRTTSYRTTLMEGDILRDSPFGTGVCP